MEGREGTLYFQIIHGRVARQINTGYRLFPSEWDGRMSEIILPVSGDARRSLLLALKERMEKDIRRLESIIAGLERSGGTYPASRVVELFHNPPPGTAIISWSSERGSWRNWSVSARSAPPRGTPPY